MSRLRAAVRAKQEDILPARTGGHYHAFGDTKAHLTRREVGNHYRQAAHESGRIRIGRANAGEDVAFLAAEIEGQAQQLVRAVNNSAFSISATRISTLAKSSKLMVS